MGADIFFAVVVDRSFLADIHMLNMRLNEIETVGVEGNYELVVMVMKL